MTGREHDSTRPSGPSVAMTGSPPRPPPRPAHKPAPDLRSGGLLEWIAAACRHHADRTAIEWRSRRLSYRELDAKANRLADTLLNNGVGEGSTVVVMIEDRIDMIVTLLGLFRAGAVFVPLDSEAPDERLRTLMAEVTPVAAVVETTFWDRLSQLYCGTERPCKVVVLGSDPQVLNSVPNLIAVAEPREEGLTGRPAFAADAEALRYIYYTSGSTGRPKGIAGRLKGLAHFVKWEVETLGIGPGWRVSQFTIPTFDAYFRDVLVPLTVGGTVCVPPERPVYMVPHQLADWVDQARVDLVHCVPSVFSMLLDAAPDQARFKALRYVLMAGEVLPLAKVKRWREIFGDRIQLVNLYGATETTMVKFFHYVQAADLARGFIPIGKPMRGARALVLDERGEVCPPGVIGEIHIRTPFRALGYYKNPEATRQAFVVNPFGDSPDDLIYKTGDRAVMLEDGGFRFLGRHDTQVKIRGMRVELGEVEGRLCSHPAVSTAVVLACDNALVAYVVPAPPQRLTVPELRGHLKAALPSCLVPSSLVILDHLPLTPNGKVDRSALPPPGTVGTETGAAYVAPRNLTEELMSQVWSEVLPAKGVGIHDNFFDLGGHSLLALTLLARLSRVFAVELSVRQLFDGPTIAELAAQVDLLRRNKQAGDELWRQASQLLTPIHPHGTRRPFYLIPGGVGSDAEFLVYARMARYLGLDQPFYGLKARGAEGEAKPHTDVRTMASDYIRRIQACQPSGPYLLVGECVGGIVAYEMARQLLEQGERVQKLILLDTRCPPRWEYQRRRVRHFLEQVQTTTLYRALYHLARLRTLPCAAWLGYLREKMHKRRMLQATSDRPRAWGTKAGTRFASMFVPPIERHYVLTSVRYRPRLYPGRVLLLLNEEWYKTDPTGGWGPWVKGGLVTRRLPGDHLTYIRDHVEVAARCLRQCLDEQ